ncbi:MAG: hypothetical protein PHF00_11920, partial [Elusimicrobia bacterium]|nr:hypothetical protein [Elusimicrobiota bacterium]
VIRNVHFGAYSMASFLPVGPVIDKTDYSTIYTWTSLMRALLMGLIPLLYLSGGLSFGVLAIIVALNPIFQSLMTNADSAGRASIMGRDENVVRAGTAFGIKAGAIAGLFSPFLAAYAVGLLAAAFGEPGGYAIAYAGYALSLLVAVPFLKFLVRDPRHHDPEVAQKPSRNPLNIIQPLLVALRAPLAIGRAIWGRMTGKGRASAAAAARKAPEEAARPGIRERAARFFDRWEATEGLSVILRSDTLMLLMAITAVELFLADALTFVVLPNYIIDVIQPQAALASIPVIGTMLGTKAGIMGLMLTCASLGSYLGTQWISGAKGDLKIKRLGSGFFYRMAAVGSAFFWTMMIPTFLAAPGAALSLPVFFASLGIFLGMELLTRLFHAPLMTVMAPVQRKEIPNDKVGKVYAAFTMLNVGLMALGGLVLGFVVDAVPIATAVLVVSLGVSVTALLQWLSPRWLNRINPAGWEKGEKRDGA